MQTKTSKRMPQVWVKDWLFRRYEIAVEKRKAKVENFTGSEWLREAMREKLDRELGPAPKEPR